MNTVAYRCKMCGRQGQAQLGCSEDELKALGFNLSAWVAMLTCDPCYDFRERYRFLINQIFMACQLWEFTGSKKRDAMRDKVRDDLSEKTKRLVRLIADHFRQQNVWDEQIVEALMSEPDKSKTQIAHVYHAIRKGQWAAPKQQELTT